MMMKVALLLALTVVASVSALQDGPEAAGAPEPYSYSYQTDTHGAAEQRDPQGRVTGYYTLQDADGRERRVEYVADAGGFRAKVATNEVGTKNESPADVEVVAAEPSPAQYAAAAQYTQSAQYQQSAAAAGAAAAAAAPAQSSQYFRQQSYSSASAPQYSGFAQRYGYQQYGYRPYGASSYYSSGAYPYAYGANYNGAYGSNYNRAYGSNYNGAYGGYGAAYYSGGLPSGVSYYSQGAPSGYYGYSSNYAAPAGGQYYSSYRSSLSGNGPLAPAGGIRSFVSQPAVTTTYRQVSSSSGAAPAGVATYSSEFPSSTGGVSGSTAGGSASSTRSASYQGSSNYIVLKKRETA